MVNWWFSSDIQLQKQTKWKQWKSWITLALTKLTGKFSLVLAREGVASHNLVRVVPRKVKNPQPMLLLSSKGYEYTWTEPCFNHILWGCAGKWFHIQLKVYVNADVGKGFTAVCWNNPRFFQPCSQFVNPAAFMAKPRRDWSQILLRVQVNLWRSLWDFPIATGAQGLQEMTENCDCNNADGGAPDHSRLFNHTKYSLG